MQTKVDKLKKELLELPIGVQDKVELWLAYRRMKPVSTILLAKKRESGHLKEDQTRTIQWIKNARMSYVIDERNKNTAHVSTDSLSATKISKIMWSNEHDDIIEKGKLFGYPKEASIVYADQFPKFSRGEQGKEKWRLTGISPERGRQLGIYWWSYVRFGIRKDHLREDSLVAKRWADEIQSELPTLAKQFEEALEKAKRFVK